MAARKSTTAKKKNAPARGKPKRPFIIDFHGHIVNPDIFALTAKHTLHARIGLGKKTSLGNAKKSQETMARMVNNDLRIKDMDKMGVDMMVVSPSLIHHNTTWADGATAAKIVRQANDTVAEAVDKYPDRLAGLGIVPLQDPARAVRELDRLVNKLGIRGVQIPTILGERELGDKKFHPFWRKAEQLNAPIFIHPAGNSDERLRKHGMAFTVGQPYEETLAMSSLIYEGVMDKFPKLKVLIAHGGGYLPYYAGRQDHAYKSGSDGGVLKRNISGYLRKFYYETVVFNTDMLEFLATKTPTSHIVMGTDYPFGEKKPYEFVRSATSISTADQDAILGKNAARLLGIRI